MLCCQENFLKEYHMRVAETTVSQELPAETPQTYLQLWRILEAWPSLNSMVILRVTSGDPSYTDITSLALGPAGSRLLREDAALFGQNDDFWRTQWAANRWDVGIHIQSNISYLLGTSSDSKALP